MSEKDKSELGLKGWLEVLQVSNTEVVISGKSQERRPGCFEQWAVFLKVLPGTTRITWGARQTCRFLFSLQMIQNVWVFFFF